MKKKKIDLPFWLSMVFLALLLFGMVIFKYVIQKEWVLNVVQVISYLYIFSMGYCFGKSRNEKPSTLKGP